MKNIIFYFSGTGNSLQVAKDLAKKIGDCQVVNLAKYDTRDKVNAERVGLVFPVYFLGIPNNVRTFLSKLQFENSPYCYAVATCGNMIGTSLKQVDDILRLKNLKLGSGFRIQMPENYILHYDGSSKEKQEILFEKEKVSVAAIHKVVTNKKIQAPEKGKYLIDSLLGKALNQAAAKSFPTKDINFIVNDQCIGCGKCEKVCSVGNITMVNGKPTWNHHCEFCMGCLQSCPTQAINYSNKTQNRKRYFNPNI